MVTKPPVTLEQAIANDIDRVMVSFSIENGGHQFNERLHALPMGDDLYCLDNSPFYAYGVSFGDIVFAPRTDGVPTFNRLVTRRGHSTYRVRLPVGRDHSAFMVHWEEFQRLHCSFEGTGDDSARLYAIDIPPGADVHVIYSLLEEGEANGYWVFEEANYCPNESSDH